MVDGWNEMKKKIDLGPDGIFSSAAWRIGKRRGGRLKSSVNVSRFLFTGMCLSSVTLREPTGSHMWPQSDHSAELRGKFQFQPLDNNNTWNRFCSSSREEKWRDHHSFDTFNSKIWDNRSVNLSYDKVLHFQMHISFNVQTFMNKVSLIYDEICNLSLGEFVYTWGWLRKGSLMGYYYGKSTFWFFGKVRWLYHLWRHREY